MNILPSNTFYKTVLYNSCCSPFSWNPPGDLVALAARRILVRHSAVYCDVHNRWVR